MASASAIDSTLPFLKGSFRVRIPYPNTIFAVGLTTHVVAVARLAFVNGYPSVESGRRERNQECERHGGKLRCVRCHELSSPIENELFDVPTRLGLLHELHDRTLLRDREEQCQEEAATLRTNQIPLDASTELALSA